MIGCLQDRAHRRHPRMCLALRRQILASREKHMSWSKTEHAGIYRHDTKEKMQVRATAKDPETEKIVERQRTLATSNLAEAIAKREELKADIKGADDYPQTRHVADFAADWANRMRREGRWSKSTYEINRHTLENHIIPQIGGLAVDDLTRGDVRRWIAYIEQAGYMQDGELKRYSRHSLQKYWVTLKGLIKAMYLEGYCDYRFIEWCKDISGPDSEIEGRRESRTLTAEELAALVEAATEHMPRWSPHIKTLAYSGMRFGESAALEWRDVDFHERIIRIRRSWTRGEIGPTKTGKERTAPMVPAVADALRIQRDRLAKEGNVGLHEDIVFPSDCGTRRSAAAIHAPMRQAAKAAGIEGIKVGPQVLRRTFTTLLGNVGVRREMIKSVTGHATDAMHDHYTEIRPEDQRVAVARMFGQEAG